MQQRFGKPRRFRLAHRRVRSWLRRERACIVAFASKRDPGKTDRAQSLEAFVQNGLVLLRHKPLYPLTMRVFDAVGLVSRSSVVALGLCGGLLGSAAPMSYAAVEAQPVVPNMVMPDKADDLAAKFVDQEHARFVSRTVDGSTTAILLEHPLVSGGVTFVILQNGKPAVMFQYSADGAPTDSAFELMSRAGSLVTGRNAAAVLDLLHRSEQDVRDAARSGIGVASFGERGLYVNYTMLPGGKGTAFTIDLE